jgi:DNA-directed RNA polymerase subunit RPC12/RpoP
MIPKTELQKKVASLSRTLPKISRVIKQWGLENCYTGQAVRSRNNLYCLECGHKWKDKSVLISTLTGCTCPKCGKRLEMMTYYRPGHRDNDYFAVITTAGDMQVIRMVFICKIYKKLHKPEWFAHEVMQHWITPGGRVTTMSLSVMGFSQYYDQWLLDSKLEVRLKTYRSAMRYNISPDKIYPMKKILPVIKRNGFRGHFHGIAPHQLFAEILSDRVAETLLKARQYSMLRYYIGHFGGSEIKDVWRGIWPSIRICIRNGYIIKDASIWVDYMSILGFYNRDLRSPHYICPADLKAAHNHWVRKKRDQERKEELRQLRETAEKRQKEYVRKRSKFFGLLFTDGNLTVKPLVSVEDFMIEGDELRHCVFASKYFEKDDSLILSASLGPKRIETVEVSLRNLEVIQARGKDNEPSKYHADVVTLVESNMYQIGKLCQNRKARVNELAEVI